MTKFQIQVHLNPAEGKETEFEAWYEEIHLPELLETVDGLLSGRRYWLRGSNLAEPANRHIAVYEIEADSGEAALAAMDARRSERDMRFELMDPSAASIAVYEPAGPMHEA